MPRLASFAIFALVFFGVISLVHVYLWLRLVHASQLPPPWRMFATGALMALALSLPIGLVLGHVLEFGARPFLRLAYVWLGLMFILFTLTVASDLLRVGWFGMQRLAEVAWGREPISFGITAIRWLAGVIVVSSFAAGSGAVVGPDEVPAVREVEVTLPRLPAALDRTTLVQLTDLHLDVIVGEQWLTKIVDRVNGLNPDLVVITGDMVDGSVETLGRAAGQLTRLRPRLGTYFVTGNHEYYSGVDDWVVELRRLGVHVLRNERVSIGTENASFDLAGIDDTGTRRFGERHGGDLTKALAGRDESRALVLLAHQPNAVRDAARLGVGLQLSGHTHGGQIWPFRYLVALTQPYLSGLSRHNDTTQIYVSNGTGHWGPPMRLGAPAEITRIVLRSPEAAK